MPVLIVDDDAFAARALARGLGNVAVVAYDLDAGLRLVAERRPAVLLLDRLFEGEARTGTDLIDTVRRLSPRTCVLIVTAHVEAADQERAMRAGACGYFDKRDVGALREAVLALLEADGDGEEVEGTVALH